MGPVSGKAWFQTIQRDLIHDCIESDSLNWRLQRQLVLVPFFGASTSVPPAEMAAHLRARALVPLLVVFAPEVVAGICDATTSNADICSVHADNDYTIPSGAHAWANCCLQGSPEVLTSCDLVPGSDGQQAVDLYDDDTRAQCCFGRGAEGSESLPNALPTGRSAPYSTFDQYCADNVADVCGMSGTQLPEGIRLTLNCHFEHIDLGSDWCPAPYAFTERGWLTSTGALVPHQCSKAFEPLVTPSGVLATRLIGEFFGDSECTQSQSLGTSPQIAVASSYDSMIADFKPTQCSELASGVYQLGFCNTADPSAPTYHQYLYSDSTCTTQIDTIQHDATGAGCTDINGAGFDVTVPFYIKTQCLPQPETPGTTFFLGENCEGQSAGIYLPPGHCGEAPNAPGQTVKNYCARTSAYCTHLPLSRPLSSGPLPCSLTCDLSDL